METWKDMILESMEDFSESWDDVVSVAGEDGIDTPFDSGFGRINGSPFTVWTQRRVYFPVCYDGAETVGSVSRDPDGVPSTHVGG